MSPPHNLPPPPKGDPGAWLWPWIIVGKRGLHSPLASGWGEMLSSHWA